MNASVMLEMCGCSLAAVRRGAVDRRLCLGGTLFRAHQPLALWVGQGPGSARIATGVAMA